MSTTSQGDGAPTGSSTDTSLNADAIRFCKDLLTKPDVTTAYYTEITTAAKNKTYETEIIDNWLVKQGYQCSITQVLLAQKQLPTYQLYYWSGGYKTLLGTSKQAGPILTIHAFEKGAQQIGYGQQFIIDAAFSNLVLSWSTDEGLNDTSGSLTFTLSSSSAGAAVRSFYGQITDSSGNSQPIAGALMTTDELQGAVNKKQAPPGQDMNALKIAETVVNFVAQATFITLNFFMLYKTGKELQQLKAKLEENPGDKEAQDVADKEKEQEGLESDNEDAMDQGADLEAAYAEQPASDIENVMGQAAEGADEVPLDLPESPEVPSPEEQELLNETVEESPEADPEGGGGEDDGGGGEEGGDGDVGDIFGDIGEDALDVV